MEGNIKCEQVGLVNELMQGKELAKQLCDHFMSSSSSHETKEALVEKILSTYEKALGMLNSGAKTNTMDSHCSFTNGSPRSEVLDPQVKHKDHVLKKRKTTMPSWTKQVKVCSGTGSLDDGYSWRKYGQKDILGARFPRGYYRCTHRNVQGCLATKQVQRCDEDPTICEITYRGRHTCNQASRVKKAFPSKTNTGLGKNKNHRHEKKEPEEAEATVLCFGSEVEVNIEELEAKEDIFPSFCPYENIVSDTMMECHFMQPFSLPATSESNIFCLSPCYLGSDSDNADIVSAPSSVTNYPIVDLDLFLDKVDFDTDFPINISS